MALRGLVIEVQPRTGPTLDLTDYAQIVRTTDGRPTDSDRDQPGRARLVCRIPDRYIAVDPDPTDSRQHALTILDDAELRCCARLTDGRFADWWTGRIVDSQLIDPESGTETTLVVVAVDLVAQIALAGSVADQALGIRAQRDNSKDILEDAAASRVTGLAVNDTLIYGLRGDRTVTMWTRDEREPADPDTWTLAAANTDPQGIAADGDLIWVVDGTTDSIHAYSTAPAVAADARRDAAYPTATTNPRRLAWGLGQLWIVDGRNVRAAGDGGTFTLDAAITSPRGILIDDTDPANPTVQILDSDGTIYAHRRTTTIGPSWERRAGHDMSNLPAVPPQGRAHIPRRNDGFRSRISAAAGYRIAAIWVPQPGGSSAQVRLEYDNGTNEDTLLGNSRAVSTYNLLHALLALPSTPPSGRVAMRTWNELSRIHKASNGSLDVNPDVTVAGPKRFNRQRGTDWARIDGIGGPDRAVGWADGHMWIYDDYDADVGDGTTKTAVVLRAWRDPTSAANPDPAKFARHPARDIYTEIAAANLVGPIAAWSCAVCDDYAIFDVGDGTGDFSAYAIKSGTHEPNVAYSPLPPATPRCLRGGALDEIWISAGNADDPVVAPLGGDAAKVWDRYGWWAATAQAWSPAAATLSTWARDSSRDITLAGHTGTPLDVARIGRTIFALYSDRIRAWHDNGDRDAGQDTALAANNGNPQRITADDRYLYVTDSGARAVRVYDSTTRTASPARNFAIVAGKGDASRGITRTADGWVIGAATSGYGYSATSRLTAPAAATAQNFDLAAAAHTGTPSGIAHVDGRLLVCDSGQSTLRSYSPAGVRQPDRDIPDPSARTWRGLTTDGVNIWAIDDSTDSAIAFLSASGTRRASFDFDVDTLNRDPSAILVDGGDTALVADADDPIIYGYDLARIDSIERPRESAADRYRAAVSLAAQTAPAAAAGSTDLPAGAIAGSISDAAAAIETAEYGRAVAGQLIPRGRHRANRNSRTLHVATQPGQVTDAVLPATPPAYDTSTALVATEIVATSSDNVEITESRAAGRSRIRRYATAADPRRTAAVARWIAANTAEPLPHLTITIDLEAETDRDAATALWSQPHTAVIADISFAGSTATDPQPWLVAHRTVDIRAIGAGTKAAAVTLDCVPPRRLQVGWLLADPQRSLLGATTVLTPDA